MEKRFVNIIIFLVAFIFLELVVLVFVLQDNFSSELNGSIPLNNSQEKTVLNNSTFVAKKLSDEVAVENSVDLSNFTSEILILQESYSNEFAYVPEYAPTKFTTNYTAIYKKIYSEHEDIYDFMIVAIQNRTFANSNSGEVNFDVKGLGKFPNGAHSAPNYTTRLKSFIQWETLGNYKIYPDRFDSGIPKTLAHEMAHHWCCNLEGFGITLPGHWTNNLDLYQGNSEYVDVMGYNAWIVNETSQECITGNNHKRSFSQLTLYLMGLLPAKDVMPIRVSLFNPRPVKSAYNDWGPSCYDVPGFTETKTITIEEIQNINGVRIPSYENSQKNFSVVFVLIVPFGISLDTQLLNYMQMYRTALPSTWANFTGNRSHLSV